jgi:hypothetical protein
MTFWLITPYSILVYADVSAEHTISIVSSDVKTDERQSQDIHNVCNSRPTFVFYIL